MWVVEELRKDTWARISSAVAEQEAQTALRLLRSSRPWRVYRVVPA